MFIRFRAPDEIEAEKADNIEDLPDQIARNPNIKEGALATDDNRAVVGQEQFLVMIGVCTHLGCVPIGDGAGDFGA